MEFVILKINGEDLSCASHDHIIKVFQTVSEPIIVEVARRSRNNSHLTTTTNQTDPSMTDLSINMKTYFDELVNPYSTATLPREQGGVFTNSPLIQRSNNYRAHDHHLGASINPNHRLQCKPADDTCIDLLRMNDTADECDDDEDEEVEIVKQMVTLRKMHRREIFGLTLSYSALAANDNAESEVYISAIEVNSVASRQRAIRVGDQILQINNTDVHSKAQVVSLFQGCGLEVTMLLGRPVLPIQGLKSVFNHHSAIVDEAEYSLVYDDVGCFKDDDRYLSQLDKDSGIERGVDGTTKTEESSECDSADVSYYKWNKFSSLDSSDGPVDLEQIALIMRHLALEYQQLQQLLQYSPECNSSQIHPLPPPTLNKSNLSRPVPRMGTKLDNPQLKVQTTTTQGSSSTTSSCTRDFDSACSSPITMELERSNHSTSLLSLKLDSKKRLVTYRDENHQSLSHTSPLSASTKCQIDVSNQHPDSVRKTHPDGHHYYEVYDSCGANKTQVKHGSMGPKIRSQNIEHQHISESHLSKVDNSMEWVLKKRPDGTKYISRRPIRSRTSKDRSKRNIDQRGTLSGECEQNSMDFKINKYLGMSSQNRLRDPPREIATGWKEGLESTQSNVSKDCLGLSRRDSNNCDRNISKQRLISEQSISMGTSLF